MAGKRLVTADAFVEKIKAAVDAREDGDFTIIARTDAIAVEGFDKAIERAILYSEAGADVVLPVLKVVMKKWWLSINDEASLIRLAAQLEKVQPWAGRKPPVCYS